MEKIADGFYRFSEVKYPTEDVSVKMEIDKIDGEDLDTSVSISGKFAICGRERAEFIDKLGALIDLYRI